MEYGENGKMVFLHCDARARMGRFSTETTQGGYFLVERDKEFLVWREQHMPNISPRFSGGKLPGRKVEQGREGEEEWEEGHNKKMENGVVNEILAGVPRETDAAGSGVAQVAVFVAQSTNAGRDPGTASGMKQKWDCSQVEDEFGEGDGMEWLEGDDLMRQWEEVSKEEEKTEVRKFVGRSSQIEGVQKAPEVLVFEVFTKEKEAKKEKKKNSKVARWSTETMEEKASKQKFRDGRNIAMEEQRSRGN